MVRSGWGGLVGVSGGQVGGESPLVGEVALDALAGRGVGDRDGDHLAYHDVGVAGRVVLGAQDVAVDRRIRCGDPVGGSFECSVTPHAPAGRVRLERLHVADVVRVRRPRPEVVADVHRTRIVRVRRAEVVGLDVVERSAVLAGGRRMHSDRGAIRISPSSADALPRPVHTVGRVAHEGREGDQ